MLDVRAAIWDRTDQPITLLPSAPPQTNTPKVNSSKFLAGLLKFRQEEQWFSMRLFGYLHLALELNMLTGHQLQTILVPASRAYDRPPADGEEAEPLRRPVPEEQALRNSCKNSVTLACAVFSDCDNLTRQRLISRLLEPWREWFSTQSTMLRSCDRAWSGR